MSLVPAGRRTHERHGRQVDITLVYKGREIPAQSRDVSLGGMFIQTEAVLPYGVEVTLRFQAPGMKDSTEIAAIVRWLADDGVGIQFGSLRAMEVWMLNQLFYDELEPD